MKTNTFHAKKALLMLFVMLLPMLVSAHDFEVDGIYYKVTSSTDLTVGVTCKGDFYDNYSNEYGRAVSIPSTVSYKGNTYNVTSIENQAFSGCLILTTITLPESVTSIGAFAFCNCHSLTAITIPEGVTTIGDDAFYRCTSLTSITIPESVTSIGQSAFSGCSRLTSITIPESVTKIEGYVFEYCSSLTAITIPKSVTEIGYGAFSGCIFTSDNFINNSACTSNDNWGGRTL